MLLKLKLILTFVLFTVIFMPFSQCSSIYEENKEQVNIRYVINLEELNIVDTPMGMIGFILPLFLTLLKFYKKIRSYYWLSLEYISTATVLFMVWWDYKMSTLLIGGYIAGIVGCLYFILLCIEIFLIKKSKK